MEQIKKKDQKNVLYCISSIRCTRKYEYTCTVMRVNIKSAQSK